MQTIAQLETAWRVARDRYQAERRARALRLEARYGYRVDVQLLDGRWIARPIISDHWVPLADLDDAE